MKEEDFLAKVKELLNAYQQLPIISTIRARLRAELKANLIYHSANHTDDVMHETILFAVVDGLTEKEMELLAVAAAYHDAGFIVCDTQNEPIGAQMAELNMRHFGSYSEKEIELVKRMILDTQLVLKETGNLQIASNELSKYLLDGDLSNLGRKDFFQKVELNMAEQRLKSDEFLELTRDLLSAHVWLTPAGNALRSAGQFENLKSLNARLASFKTKE